MTIGLNLFTDSTERIRAIWRHEPSSRKSGFFALLLAGFINGLLEALGISIVMPLIHLIQSPERIDHYPLFVDMKEALNLVSHGSFVILLAASMGGVFVLRGIYLLGFNYILAAYLSTGQVLLSKKLFANYIYSAYHETQSVPTATLLRNIKLAENVHGKFVSAVIRLIVDVMVIGTLLSLVLYIRPVVTIAGLGLSLTLITVQSRFLTSRLRQAAKTLNERDLQTNKSIFQGFHALKETKVLGCEGFFLTAFAQNQVFKKQWTRRQLFYRFIPGIVNENTFVFVVLGTVIVIMATETRLDMTLGTLALMAAAIFRMIPYSNRIMQGINMLASAENQTDIVLKELEDYAAPHIAEDETPAAEWRPRRSIELRNVDFQYPTRNRPALHDINISIEVGERVGLVGHSGSGKSTLVDLIMGLLEPTTGDILVDGRSIRLDPRPWQRNIGYVPQSVYIVDDSVIANVAFGKKPEEIDIERVDWAIRQANLENFVARLPEGFHSSLGENGRLCSGGERQRLGIARALYCDPKVLIMDEPTSSLDLKSESIINEALENVATDRTVIIIAHRLSSVRKCDRIFFLEDGRLVDSGTFDGLKMANARFSELVSLGDLS